MRCSARSDPEGHGRARGRRARGPERIRLRIGINLGDVVHEEGDLYGDGVNIAARLEQLAEPGGIAISGTAHDQLQGKLDCGFAFRRRAAGQEHRAPGAGLPRLARWRACRLAPIGSGKTPEVGCCGCRGCRPPGASRRRHGWWFWPTTPAGAGKPSIAVLPFDNLGGDEATGRLADGITEDIITDLARFREPRRDRPQLDRGLQGQAGRRAPGRQGARRRLRARGLDPAPGRPRAGHRPADRRDDRRPCLVGALGPPGRGRVRGPDRGRRAGGEHARRVRAAARREPGGGQAQAARGP